jgi:hypothetical protein
MTDETPRGLGSPQCAAAGPAALAVAHLQLVLFYRCRSISNGFGDYAGVKPKQKPLRADHLNPSSVAPEADTDAGSHNAITLGRLLSDISSRAIIVEDMTDFLDECLWVMGHALDVGGVYVWQYDAQARTFGNIAEWMPEDVSSFKETLQHIPEEIAPWFTSALRQNLTIELPDTRTILDPKVRSIVLSMGIQSILVIPIHVKTRLFGFLGCGHDVLLVWVRMFGKTSIPERTTPTMFG